MPGRWDNQQERGYRSGEDDYDRFGYDDGRDRARYPGREDRVFGERESGVEYNRPQRGNMDRGGDRPDWQERDYQGVSPAFSHHRDAYDSGYRANPRFQNQDYTRGGRFYGDDGRKRIYGEEYGAAPRQEYEEGRRFGSREADERYERAVRQPSYGAHPRPDRTYAGGTGGYDYERGYGDAGRGRDGGEFEDRAREAGDFFRRTGRKISNWFSDVAGDVRGEDPGYTAFRGHRGVGPHGYRRADERIQDEVHERLTDDHWLDASGITVSVSGGEVTLSGNVPDRDSKHRAERIVEDLAGVVHVQNNLRLKATGRDAATTTRGFAGSGPEARREDPVKDITDGEATPPAQKRN